jgi:DNA-binding NtrC family response regulator
VEKLKQLRARNLGQFWGDFGPFSHRKICYSKEVEIILAQIFLLRKEIMKKRILVVDDEPNLAFLLAENLHDLGPDYDIEVSHSGAEALDLNQEHPFDLVITDLMMPEMNGLILTRHLIKQQPGIKLILMTAYGNEEIALKAKNLGICSYITKPFEMEDMLVAVQTAFTQTQFEPETTGSGHSYYAQV